MPNQTFNIYSATQSGVCTQYTQNNNNNTKSSWHPLPFCLLLLPPHHLSNNYYQAGLPFLKEGAFNMCLQAMDCPPPAAPSDMKQMNHSLKLSSCLKLL